MKFGSLQELFDHVINFLHQQGKPSINGLTGMCAYRAADGSKCAAGCLIPDELFELKMEGKHWGCVVENNSELYRLFSEDQHRLIRGLQTLHDYHPQVPAPCPGSWGDYVWNLQNLLKDFDLQNTIPEGSWLCPPAEP